MTKYLGLRHRYVCPLWHLLPEELSLVAVEDLLQQVTFTLFDEFLHLYCDGFLLLAFRLHGNLLRRHEMQHNGHAQSTDVIR